MDTDGFAGFDAAAIAEAEFGKARLGHRARNKRAVRIAIDFLSKPAASIPKQAGTKSAAKRLYEFVGHPGISAMDLRSGHEAQTTARCLTREKVLVIADGSSLDFKSHTAMRGIGVIGNGSGRGLLMHTMFAVDAATLEPIGVLDQETWVRSDGPSQRHKGEAAYSKKKRQKLPERESLVWVRGIERVAQQFGAHMDPTNTLLIGDRGSDIYEVFEACKARGMGYVLRAAQNRRIDQGSAPEEHRHLFDAVDAAAVLATKDVFIPHKPGRKARTARVEIRAVEIGIKAPQTRRDRKEPMPLRVISVHEVDAPADIKEPLCWYLLTSEPIATAEDVLRVLGYYEARWIIEEFHMGLKTGCALEQRQFESRHSVENYLAFANVVAWTLLRMRSVSRRSPALQIDAVLTPTQQETLYALRPKLRRGCSAHEAMITIASMGGYMGNKRDMPGWRTLWQGFEQLLLAERGYCAAKNLPVSGLIGAAEEIRE